MSAPGKIIKTFTTERGAEVVLRYPQQDDVEEVLRYINELSAEDTFIRWSGEVATFEEEKEWVTKIIKEMEEGNGSHLHAFVGDKMIGSTGVSRKGKRNEHMGHIGISVAKEYRDQGIGSVLFESILDEAKALGFTLVDLEVYSTNDRAYNLYKKFGFIDAGRVPGAVRYKDGFLDEIWMYKKL